MKQSQAPDVQPGSGGIGDGMGFSREKLFCCPSFGAPPPPVVMIPSCPAKFLCNKPLELAI